MHDYILKMFHIRKIKGECQRGMPKLSLGQITESSSNNWVRLTRRTVLTQNIGPFFFSVYMQFPGSVCIRYMQFPGSLCILYMQFPGSVCIRYMQFLCWLVLLLYVYILGGKISVVGIRGILRPSWCIENKYSKCPAKPAVSHVIIERIDNGNKKLTEMNDSFN